MFCRMLCVLSGRVSALSSPPYIVPKEIRQRVIAEEEEADYCNKNYYNYNSQDASNVTLLAVWTGDQKQRKHNVKKSPKLPPFWGGREEKDGALLGSSLWARDNSFGSAAHKNKVVFLVLPTQTLFIVIFPKGALCTLVHTIVRKWLFWVFYSAEFGC